jgi:hemolysin activation/secretion protein
LNRHIHSYSTVPRRFPRSLLGTVLLASLSGLQAAPETFEVLEYRITGATHLSELEKGRAVYPFLGPGRTAEDVESARTALQALYQSRGYETVFVEVPLTRPRRGIVHLKVTENTVGRLRVTGSQFFLPSQVEKQARSLAPGTLPQFDAVRADLLALNGWPDRRVTPSIRQGEEPGTVDVDLQVEDSLPLHGSIELNNRHSAGTSDLRLNGALNYGNLWQRGHGLGTSFQIAPQNIEEVQVFSGYYLARIPEFPSLTLLLQGTRQQSNVSTLGGAAVNGRGEIFGGRAILNLPSRAGFQHTASFGLDYKRFQQGLQIGATSLKTPIHYHPLTLGHSASWSGTNTETDTNLSATWALRGSGSPESQFKQNRFNSRSSFFLLRGDASHTVTLPNRFQVFVKTQGQMSASPLLSSEQFAGGGLSSARGYLEGEAAGDSALFGTFELRSPSLLGSTIKNSEWRIHLFGDAGLLWVEDSLAGQSNRFRLASFGIGTRFRLGEHANGSLELAQPLLDPTETSSGDPFLSFRLWSDF